MKMARHNGLFKKSYLFLLKKNAESADMGSVLLAEGKFGIE